MLVHGASHKNASHKKFEDAGCKPEMSEYIHHSLFPHCVAGAGIWFLFTQFT